MTPTQPPLARRIAAGLLMSVALAGAAFELLRRWWVDLARRPVGRWP